MALHTLADWRKAYCEDGATPRDLIGRLVASFAADDTAWLLRCEPAFIEAQITRLEGIAPHELPLWGVPFAVKDNIDVDGLVTTAACPAFAHRAMRSATVIRRLQAAGAIVVGKTNLDQFATGLVGTRSPYGEVPNTFDPAYVSGGSSSGSASVVARGLVPFALGTDTAGSGRVPAGFNNIVGLKPTPGSVPMHGVLPACRTLDVVSVFALTAADAALVMSLMEGASGEPGFQRHAPRVPWLGLEGRPLRVGVPRDPGCDEDLGYAAAFEEAKARLASMGVMIQPVDMAPFDAVARLLYHGPWVAERYAIVAQLMERQPEQLDPTVHEVIDQARAFTAADGFAARYRLEQLRLQIVPLWHELDFLMLPTAPTCPTRTAVLDGPILRNSELGRYTNFVNLLGLSALAMPSGFTPFGLPFGVTFVAAPGADAALTHWGLRWEAAHAHLPLGAKLRAKRGQDLTLLKAPVAAPTLEIAVVGAHLSGMPLHGQLLERGCRLVEKTRTAAHYRLHALPGTVPPKPGLARVADGAPGTAIEVEVYEMPQADVGSFLALIPPPLGLGTVELQDGRCVKGFICEPAALEGAPDISAHGGWRAYMASLQP
ncbi:allophanate hydrolase [Pelomonas sp. KK5]|uniref:allophanate hydrolase n=1 Tax=Pelomonas sp. KK5 TaxID=1855730 RepID=UPI00097BFD24|nr:allophanate hydrolase [Pelomonas sp. KK5]